MSAEVLQFKRPDGRAEQWITEEAFRKELANHLGGHVPSYAWLYLRRKEGLPDKRCVGKVLVPLERGLKWLREEGRIP